MMTAHIALQCEETAPALVGRSLNFLMLCTLMRFVSQFFAAGFPTCRAARASSKPQLEVTRSQIDVDSHEQPWSSAPVSAGWSVTLLIAGRHCRIRRNHGLLFGSHCRAVYPCNTSPMKDAAIRRPHLSARRAQTGPSAVHLPRAAAAALASVT
jgi:hypothetical protein